MTNASREDEGVKQECKVPPTFGTEQYLQWNAEFIKAIGKIHSESIRRVINPCRLHLEVLLAKRILYIYTFIVRLFIALHFKTISNHYYYGHFTIFTDTIQGVQQGCYGAQGCTNS